MIKKIIVGLLVLVIVLGIVIGFIFLNRNETEEQTQEREDYGQMNEKRERTDEEYIAVFLDNREDFEYIAKIMGNYEDVWILTGEIPAKDESRYTRIDDYYYTNNKKISDEALNNEELYSHLINLKSLDEIESISDEEDVIAFHFKYNPQDYLISVCYGESIEDRLKFGPSIKIDDHWFLEVFPCI